MSTQCRFAKREKDGSFTGVTCHYDGYPSHMQRVLEHFTLEESIDKLLSSHIDNIKFSNFRPVVKHIEKKDPVFEWEEIEKYDSYEDVLEQKDRRGHVLGVAHIYIYDEGEWYGYYPYCQMEPVRIDKYIDHLKLHSGEDEDVEW